MEYPTHSRLTPREKILAEEYYVCRTLETFIREAVVEGEGAERARGHSETEAERLVSGIFITTSELAS